METIFEASFSSATLSIRPVSVFEKKKPRQKKKKPRKTLVSSYLSLKCSWFINNLNLSIADVENVFSEGWLTVGDASTLCFRSSQAHSESTSHSSWTRHTSQCTCQINLHLTTMPCLFIFIRKFVATNDGEREGRQMKCLSLKNR